MQQNYNLASYTIKEHFHLTAGDTQQKIPNFKSAYLNAVSTRSSAVGAPAGPLRIWDRGNERLLAEWGATPGRRYDSKELVIGQRQWLSLGVMLTKIRNPYRQRLLRNKLAYFLPRASLAKPFTHVIKLSKTVLVLAGLVTRAYRDLLRRAADSTEEEKFVQT